MQLMMNLVSEVITLHRFGALYDKLLRPKNESNAQIQEQLSRLNVMQATTAYPLLLHFYDLYDRKQISGHEFIEILRVLENYLVRRFLAGEPTNYHNSMFTSLARDLSLTGGKTAATLERGLGERNYPSDSRLRQRLIWNRLYSAGKSSRIVFIMETLNRRLDGDSKLDGDGTVEHIMPQRLTSEWQAHIGQDWQDTHRELLHTIGNLTIVTLKWNAHKLSNKPFLEKRAKLLSHGIHLNSNYFSQAARKWDAVAIRARTNHLADLILEVWSSFAEAPRTDGVKGKTPLLLVVCGEIFAVHSWRGMALEMVNRLHDLRLLVDLEGALPSFEWWIVRDPGSSKKYYKQSSQGWWIQQNLTAENAVYFCGMLAKHCGLSDDEWSFTYE